MADETQTVVDLAAFEAMKAELARTKMDLKDYKKKDDDIQKNVLHYPSYPELKKQGEYTAEEMKKLLLAKANKELKEYFMSHNPRHKPSQMLDKGQCGVALKEKIEQVAFEYQPHFPLKLEKFMDDFSERPGYTSRQLITEVIPGTFSVTERPVEKDSIIFDLLYNNVIVGWVVPSDGTPAYSKYTSSPMTSGDKLRCTIRIFRGEVKEK